MEINKYTDIMGVVVVEDIAEGRMVLLTSNTSGTFEGASLGASGDSGSDLPGVKLPDDATEAARAQYVVTWPVSNANAAGDINLFIPTPSFDWALRAGGWDQSSNVPFDAEVHLTYPGQKHGVTIPSGYQALAFDDGVFTVPSGSWSYDAALETPGAPLRAMNTADDSAADAGKLAHDSGGTATIARVERYDSETGDLTFRTLNV